MKESGRVFFFFLKCSWSFSTTDITYCGIDRLCSCIGHCKRELNPCNMLKPLRMGVKMSWNHFGPWKKIIIHLEIHKATRKLWNWHKFRDLNFPIYSEYTYKMETNVYYMYSMEHSCNQRWNMPWHNLFEVWIKVWLKCLIRNSCYQQLLIWVIVYNADRQINTFWCGKKNCI